MSRLVYKMYDSDRPRQTALGMAGEVERDLVLERIALDGIAWTQAVHEPIEGGADALEVRDAHVLWIIRYDATLPPREQAMALRRLYQRLTCPRPVSASRMLT